MDMITEKTWKEFRETGLLWFINSILHLFGWSICLDYDEQFQKVQRAFPARCKFRGFSEDINDFGYQQISKYLKNNIDDLILETNDEKTSER